jgi:hypothetical protein
VRPHLLTPANGANVFVACKASADCYLATGGEAAWRYDGKTIAAAPVPGGDTVLAVSRSADDDIIAIWRTADEHGLRLATLGKDGFAPIPRVEIKTPETPSVPFARFGPDGLLWVGLELGSGDDATPFGVATVDMAIDAITYHRAAARGKDALHIPPDVIDVAFDGGDTWFASLSGAAHVHGDDVTVWSEANGLVSEILHGIAVDDHGHVYVASTDGVGVFDGKGWSYPQPLAFPVAAITRDKQGRLWLGTDKGLFWWDGAQVIKQPNLLDDEVDAIAADAFGRVWVRQPNGLVLITP